MVEAPCLIWRGAKRNGYGARHRRGKTVYVHRDKWESLRGPIPDGMFVCHHCDTPACYEISHLFLGTNADNMADAAAKGRVHPRERHGMARLTSEQVRIIRETPRTFGVGVALARRFGVHPNTVYSVWRGDNWSSLL